MTPAALKPRVGHPGRRATPPPFGSSLSRHPTQGAERGLFLVSKSLMCGHLCRNKFRNR